MSQGRNKKNLNVRTSLIQEKLKIRYENLASVIQDAKRGSLSLEELKNLKSELESSVKLSDSLVVQVAECHPASGKYKQALPKGYQLDITAVDKAISRAQSPQSQAQQLSENSIGTGIKPIKKATQEKVSNFRFAALELIKLIDKSLAINAPEGIFRQAANTELLQKKMSEIQQGKIEFGDMNQIERADLLKHVLRKLRADEGPIFTKQQFEQGKSLLEAWNESLPYNSKVAYFLLKLMNKVCQKPETKMNASNLAVVIAPCLFPELPPTPKKISPQESLELIKKHSADLGKKNILVAELITNAHLLKKPEMPTIISATDKKIGFFKPRSSTLNVSNPNMGSSHVQADFFRAAGADENISINGISLKLLSNQFNEFKTESDVLDFFEKIILKDFTGTEAEKKNASSYLRKTFHQGGLLYPVSSALATQLKDRQGNDVTIMGRSREFKISIETTSSGFRIQEYCNVKQLIPVLGSRLSKYIEEDQPYIYSEGGLIKAEATIEIDFSKDSSHPSLIVESNHMEILHNGLKDALADYRSLGQMIVDFFKNIFGKNAVKDISSLASFAIIEDSEDSNANKMMP